MKTRHSEIFENYAKIALDTGIVKEAEEKTDPRYDSQDLTDIQILYGVNPNPEQKKDILDQAHPVPVIVSPAHDKVNGLLENLKERQNVMVGIATKPTNGMLTNHIYAKANEDLLNELLKLGCFLDNKNDLELMKLADSCSERLTKEAVLPLIAWIGIAAVTALTGASLSNNFGGMIDQGVNKNAGRAISELQDVLEEEKYQGIASSVGQMIKNISYVKTLGDKAAVLSLPKPSVDNLTDSSKNEQYKKAKDLLDDYADACGTLAEYMPTYIELLKTTVESDTTDPDWWAAVKKVYHVVMPTEIKDAITAMETLQSSLAASVAEIAKRKAAVESYVENNKQNIYNQVKSRMEEKSKIDSIEDKINTKHQESENNPGSSPDDDDVDEAIKSL